MECSEMNFVTTCVSLDSCGCCSLLFLLVFCFDFLRFEGKKIVPDIICPFVEEIWILRAKLAIVIFSDSCICMPCSHFSHFSLGI